MMVELRRLKLRDLNAIEVIERSSYPTRGRARCSPASSQSRPRSCLGAIEVDTEELVGYLIISAMSTPGT